METLAHTNEYNGRLGEGKKRSSDMAFNITKTREWQLVVQMT